MARNDLKEKIYGRRGHKRASVSSEAGGDVFVTADKTNNEWLCVVCGGGGVEGAIDRPSRSSLSLATTLLFLSHFWSLSAQSDLQQLKLLAFYRGKVVGLWERQVLLSCLRMPPRPALCLLLPVRLLQFEQTDVQLLLMPNMSVYLAVKRFLFSTSLVSTTLIPFLELVLM